MRLQSAECTEAERAELERWLALGEAQRAAYARAETLWASLDGLRAAATPALAEARATRGRARTRIRRTLIGLLLSISVGSAGWFWAQGGTPYETALGERRAIVLADGSRLDINTATRLTVRLSRDRREIALEQGEALFEVAPDPARPFVVTAGALRIRDLGTRFDVDRRPERVTVAVLEGLVRIDDDRAVRAERIPPGHRRSYVLTGELGPDEAIDVSEVSAWREGRLRFKATPLAEVAAELERYHPVRFIFADPALRSVPLSGTFDSADLDPFLRALGRILRVRAERPDPTTIVLQKMRD